MIRKITQKEALLRIHNLSQEIERHRRLYHTLDQPTISDEAYDSLLSELATLEQAFPSLKRTNSPTERVGAEPLTSFQKVKHQNRQWSFDDVFDFAELRAWDERIKRFLNKEVRNWKPVRSTDGLEIRNSVPQYVCELKIDGLKAVLTYEKGILVRGATRGDGEIGEDVTANLRTIEHIPLTLTRPIDITVVGEVWLSKDELIRINNERRAKDEPLFANPRNAAAGSLRQLDSRVIAGRKLDAFVYDIDAIIGIPFPKTQEAELLLLQELGFHVNREYRVCQTTADVEAYYEEWNIKRESVPYALDGIVIKVNAKNLQDALGYRGKSPRFGVAYKFPAEQATTIIQDVQVQIGRTGALTPVAHLRPVRVAGSVVSRATLHNFDEIDRLGVRIGDTVIIQKAGDIIPEIVSVIESLRTGKETIIVAPEKCPICESRVERMVMGTNDMSAALYCTNPRCFAIEREQIIHSVSKKGLNIVGLGEKIVEVLLQEGLIKNIGDIFSLTAGDLSPLERFGDKSAEKLARAIQNAKQVPFDKLLFALGIRYVGEETANLIVDATMKQSLHFQIKNLSDIIKYFPEITEEAWLSVDGIGIKSAQSLVEWFGDTRNQELLETLREQEVEIVVPEKHDLSTQIFSGKVFVLTGELASFTRDELKAIIKEKGGTVSSTVSRKTDYVVAGENPGSKYVNAKKLGINILNEDELKKLLET
ncbi:MAG: NAD-dependent DNA ligase LigA [Candidatus Moranbacteria bacterium]|nr:NAD-dependent DNA ligase LigA [Candidatus Moranbacteria bacterium]MDD3965389.1 NAD-dependent DNA ligase LigA [Candidatus Moranbacteria bacterium]